MTPAILWFANAKQLCNESSFLSDLSTDDEDNVPVAPEVIRCNLATWKEIVGITFVEEEHRLIVIDCWFRSISYCKCSLPLATAKSRPSDIKINDSGNS